MESYIDGDIMKAFIKKYSHAWTLLYILIYIPWFYTLERTITPQSDFTNLHVAFDDMIPFCEWFIIPYVIWFVYIPIVVAFVLFTSKDEFYYASAYLFIGMSVCLLICTLWPNGQDLRVESFVNDNFCTKIMGFIYTADTNTNVFPSIHVFNSVGAFIVLCKSHKLKDKVWIKICSGILSILIILSTMFLKQHSVVDVIGGITLSILMHVFVYAINWSKIFDKEKRNKTTKSEVNI